ncbi:hypothetical protein S40288_04009, partial [Stachybotrys chartarum IBT 40288]
RYSQETSTSITIDPPPQPPQLVNLFPPPILGTNLQYSQDGGSFFQNPAPHIFTGLDSRSRLPLRAYRCSSNTTAPAGMAHTHSLRTSTLPHPTAHMSARDQYAPATPGFRRASEHLSRSPSLSGSAVRRLPMSPTPTQLSGRVDSGQFQSRTSQNSVPPLTTFTPFGNLQYMDGGASTPVKIDIFGTIDKGFFIADGQWTCYRRNYFTCVCSFSLTPYFPSAPIQFIPQQPPSQPLQVHGFAMSISAVVSDSDQHSIDLVQHTPKRDKGPTQAPEKVVLRPKQSMSSHHHHHHHHPLSIYGDGGAVAMTRGLYSDSFGGSSDSAQNIPMEHTFERIQFKQATQNNGKRRAAQQYYHLVVELWAAVKTQANEEFVKIATNKSAKMIVRGRSPGHYQTDRRGSQSSGPGGSAGNLGAFAGLGAMNDFAANAMLGSTGGTGYGTGYQHRGALYSGVRHQLPTEVMIPPEQDRDITTTKDYQYYPGAMYADQQEQVDMFTHRGAADAVVSNMPYRGPPAGPNQRRCGPFEGRPSTGGYYPALMSSSGVSTTMT